MLAALLLLLAVTPVSLTVDLSKSTTARLGPRVRALIEERLLEEGFSVEPGGKLKLSVEELHGTLRLSAQAGAHSESSELRPAVEWPAELGFELAQRLSVREIVFPGRARQGQRCVSMEDGSVLITGGMDSAGRVIDEIWRFVDGE